jgi:hypothetical protein
VSTLTGRPCAGAALAGSTRMRTRLELAFIGEQGRWSLSGRGRSPNLAEAEAPIRRSLMDGWTVPMAEWGSEVINELSRGTFLFTLKSPIRLPVFSLRPST